MVQWHPLFAQLLRPLLESHYEVRTNMPVGDLPREADVVLLRRATVGALPYTGLWRWLSPWNVLEFKMKSKDLEPDFRVLVRLFGVKPIIDQLGIKPIIDQLGVKPIIDEIGVASLLKELTPAQRQEALRILEGSPHPARKQPKG